MNKGIPTAPIPCKAPDNAIIITRRLTKYVMNVVYIAGTIKPKPIPITILSNKDAYLV